MQERDCVGLAGEMCWLPGETDWCGRCRLHRRIFVDSWTSGSSLTLVQLQVELSLLKPANHGLIIPGTPPRVPAKPCNVQRAVCCCAPSPPAVLPQREFQTFQASRVFSAATGHEGFIPFEHFYADKTQTANSHGHTGGWALDVVVHHITPCQDSSRLPSRSLGLVQRSDLGGLEGYRAALEG